MPPTFTVPSAAMAEDVCSEKSFEDLAQNDDLESLATHDSQWIVVDHEDLASDAADEEVQDVNSEDAANVTEEVSHPSARLLTCNGINSCEHLNLIPGSCGADLSELCNPALQAFPAVNGSYCIGRLAISRGEAATGSQLSALATVVVQNCGEEAWPEETALRLVAGESYGFEMLHIGALLPGHAAELNLDFAIPVPPAWLSGGGRSAWILADQFGEPFGPLLALEVIC
eukprot:TRINITY_DN22061_c0_g1_i2.p1 TRINITY_DN22061_c0_g1~~TRINITY_DN22061_c0_g1_i2.p1  ORF type:complete len:229 (+),score=57.38 TRINITY_DN22061_c0_g1_i2:39-725(+)